LRRTGKRAIAGLRALRAATFAIALGALAILGTSRLYAIESLDAAGVQAEWQRMVAQRDLERAEDQVARAQLELQAAQQAFDQFVREHFEELSRRPAKQPSAPEARTPKPTAKELNPERERLTRQLDELVARRDQLLEGLTSVHPEVQDIEGRIGALMNRLKAAAQPAEDIPAGTPELPEGIGSEQPTSPALAADLRRYEELAARVEEAQQELDHALEAKERAARELASLPGPVAPQVVQSAPSETPAKRTVVPPATPVPQTATLEIQHGSQPLALAALLIALAVAALAAVRLARASDAVLNSVDEIASALAMPVVGIISADRPLVAMLSPLARARRGLVILAQAFVAIALFALVAYIVQDPAAVWNALVHPAEWVETLGGFRR